MSEPTWSNAIIPILSFICIISLFVLVGNFQDDSVNDLCDVCGYDEINDSSDYDSFGCCLTCESPCRWKIICEGEHLITWGYFEDGVNRFNETTYVQGVQCNNEKGFVKGNWNKNTGWKYE